VPKSWLPEKAIVWEVVPTYEIIISPESDFVFNVKFPSKSDVVPLVVPFSITLAPGSGEFNSESITIPVTVLCEKVIVVNNNTTAVNKNCVIFFILKMI